MNILDRLKNQFKCTDVIIKTDSSGNHLEWGNNRIDLPMFCPVDDAKKYVVNNRHILSKDEIKKNINLKWSTRIQENDKWAELVDNGGYIGEMNHVHCLVHNTSVDHLKIIRIFVPYFGSISVTSVDNTLYSTEDFAERILTLFKETGVIYSVKLSDREYVCKKNHMFVKEITLDEFKTLEKRVDGSREETLEKQLANQKLETWEVKQELEKSNQRISELTMEKDVLEQKWYVSEKNLSFVTDSKIEQISREKEMFDNRPDYGFDYTARNGEGAWRILGGVDEKRHVVFKGEGYPFSGEEGIRILELYYCMGDGEEMSVNAVISLLRLWDRTENIEKTVWSFLRAFVNNQLSYALYYLSNNPYIELPNLVERVDRLLSFVGVMV